MPASRLRTAAVFLTLLASCTGKVTPGTKRITYQGRVLTGATEYYHAGYQASSVGSLPQRDEKEFRFLREAPRSGL